MATTQCDNLSFELAFDILRHADVKDSARAACACKALRDMQRSDLWWKLATERLGKESRLYVSSTSAGDPIAGGTWRDEFFRLWACRDRWQEPAVDEVEKARDRFRRMIAGEVEEPGEGNGEEGGGEEVEEAAGHRDVEQGEAEASSSSSSSSSSEGSKGPAAADLIAAAEAERGSIKVCVRMRPRGVNAPRAGPASGDHKEEGVVLPLHQRLQIIKTQRGPKCTTGEAMRILMEDSGRGAEASENPWASAEVIKSARPGKDDAAAAADDDDDNHNSNVTATTTTDGDAPSQHKKALDDVTNKEGGAAGSGGGRKSTGGGDNINKTEGANTGETPEESSATAETEVRGNKDPTSGFEFTCGVLSVDEKDSRVLAVAPGVGLREFAFDAVFADGADQADVYEKSARPLIADFMNGFNGTMLVYGQTGSGKTHTMFGPGGGGGGGDVTTIDGWEEHRGVIPRACEEILDAAASRASLHGITSTISVSYVEVYGQEMTDLLRGGAPVGQSRVAGQRYVIDGHAEQQVFNMSDVCRLLAKGDAQKRRAATAMNDRSSRAHAVFTLSLIQRRDDTMSTSTSASGGRELRSRLCLADLGGSEKLSKSRANDDVAAAGTVPWAEYYSRRQRFTEAVNINSGLLALKRCIDALHEGQRAKREGKTTPPPHVPYNDSKLTTLLSGALGGDSKTVVLVAAAQEHAHASETVQSLRFGERCASVETRARVGANALAGMIAALNERIAACEEEIKASERWETVRTIRRDDVDGRDEVVLTSKLVGAEDLRAELEKMLAERDFLSGRAAASVASKEAAQRNAAPEPIIDEIDNSKVDERCI